jgi:hypothetical protein
MPQLRKRTSLEIPPEISKRFVQDMRAFFAEPNAIKQDEIAARQLHALNEHRGPRDPKLRLSAHSGKVVWRCRAIALSRPATGSL